MSDRSDSRGSVSRRSLLKSAALGAGALLAGPRRWLGGPAGAGVAEAAAARSADAKPFRFVHMTDIHVQPELRADAGMRAALRAALELRPKPDFILTGGDLVMDVLAVDEPRSKMLFDLYTRILRDCDVPVHQCVGNHDVFGWASKGKIAPSHAAYGKKMVQERLDLPSTHYSLDHKGWHFIVLDDILPSSDGGGYEAGLDEEQLAWLEADLKARPTGSATVVCAHIPIVAVAPFRSVKRAENGRVPVSKSSVCQNVGPILDVLRRYRVQLVLVGHLHERENIHYHFTTHIDDGAVCGAWWKGRHIETNEGFGVIDVKPNGTFEHHYHEYGWNAAAG